MKKNLFKVAGLGLTLAGFAYETIKNKRDREELKEELKEEILKEMNTDDKKES